jgi:hypothetical protein
VGDIRRMRGHRDEDLLARAHQVASGQSAFESNHVVLSMAADIILEPYLKAARVEDKGGILSYRQIIRRKSREVFLGEGMESLDLQHVASYTRRTTPRFVIDSEE